MQCRSSRISQHQQKPRQGDQLIHRRYTKPSPQYCIILYSIIYIAPLNSRGPTEFAFGSISSKKREVLRSAKEVERLDDRKEARADGGRRFQREGPATEKDLDLA